MEELITYILSYLFIGLILSFIYEILNDYYVHSKDEDKIHFDWLMRISNILFWPYMLLVFIRAMMGKYIESQVGDIIYDNKLGYCEVIDELPPEKDLTQE